MRGKTKIALPTDPVASARAAGLRYVTDSMPGIARKRAGKGFTYIDPDGRPVRDGQTLRRIRSLVIPPAWTRVWICPLATGHLQATGYDAKGRKQYRYHPLYRAFRDHVKFSRMAIFAEALTRIRKRVREDLAKSGITRERVLATTVRLLEITLIRVGNEEYAKENNSFGLTTMRSEHVDVSGATIRFRFRGKSGKNHEIELSDQRLAKVIKRCQDLPGEELFQYVTEEGELASISSEDVNDYLREITGEDFTAKDFRTWNGTVLAAIELAQMQPHSSETEAKKNIVATLKQVAERLGNRPAICRKYYVHPAILDSYTAGQLLDELTPSNELREVDGLTPIENCVARMLRKGLKEEAKALEAAPRAAA